MANSISNNYCRLHRHLCRNYRRSTGRMVSKSGQINLEKPTKYKYHVIPDIVTVFIDARWRWTLIYCFLTHVLTWLMFAVIWWLILYCHGDLEEDHLPHAANSTTWTPCVREIYDFTSIFLFSIEVYTTIGYGIRILTLECSEAMLFMCFEVIIGTIVQSFLVGIVFTKLTKPKNRAHTLMFSKHAIINQRDRNLCLIFRVGNTRKSRIISVNIYAYLLRCITKNKDRLNSEHVQLDLSVDHNDDIFFMFPVSVVHKIDENSPFYSMSANDILNSTLEILVVLEGIIESTGQPVQVKSSYINQEILWGHRFLQVVDYRKNKKCFVVDYSKFDETCRVNTPLCSAKDLKYFYS